MPAQRDESDDQTRKLLEQRLGQEMKATPVYSAEGDAIDWFFEDVPYDSEWLGNWISVFRAQNDGRIIGLKLKSVGALVERLKKLRLPIVIEAQSPDGRIVIKLKTTVCMVPWVDKGFAQHTETQDLVRAMPTDPEISLGVAA